MASRYQRGTFYQPAGTNPVPAQGATGLKNALLNFGNKLGDVGLQRSAARGRAQGIEDGSTGNVPKKRSGFTASGAAYNDAATASYVAKQQLDIEDTYTALEEQLPDNPAEFEARSEGYRKGLINAQTDPELRLKLDVLTQARSSEGAKRVRGAAVSKMRDQQRTDIVTGLKSLVEAAARKVPQNTPEAAQAQEILQSQIGELLSAGQNSGLFTAAQVLELRSRYTEAAQKGIQSSQVQDLTSKIVAKYETDILAGDGALAQLDKLQIDEETKVAVQKQVRERIGLLQSQRGRQYVLERAALNQDIASGTPSATAESDAFGLYRKGAITDEQYNSTVGQIERARVEQAKEQTDLTIGVEAFKNSTPLDPADAKTRTMMDKVFRQGVAGVERGSAEYQNTAIEIASRTNIAPTDAIAWARTIIATGDFKKSAAAANFLYRLDQSNPAAYKYVEDPKLKAYVGQVNEAINAGTPPELAVELAYKNTYQLTEAEEKAYRQRYSATLNGPQKAAAANKDALAGFLNDEGESGFFKATGTFDKSFFGGAPKAPVGLQAEFNSGIERYYAYTGGDIQQARKLAFRDVKQKWGYSTVNGSPELLPYAPEVMFPQLPVEIIRSDLQQSLSTLSVPEEIAKTARLVPSTETAGTGGLVWNIGFIDEYGSEDVIRDDSNRARRYQLPTDRARLQDAQQDLQKKSVEQARETGRRARAYNDTIRTESQNFDALRGGDPSLYLLNEPAAGLQ